MKNIKIESRTAAKTQTRSEAALERLERNGPTKQHRERSNAPNPLNTKERKAAVREKHGFKPELTLRDRAKAAGMIAAVAASVAVAPVVAEGARKAAEVPTDKELLERGWTPEQIEMKNNHFENLDSPENTTAYVDMPLTGSDD